MRSRPMAVGLITAVLLTGCSKSEGMADYDPLSPNFPDPYCNNTLNSYQLSISPERFTNMCGFVDIWVTDAGRREEGVIEASYTTTPADPFSWEGDQTFIFRNEADARGIVEGDKYAVKLFVFQWPDTDSDLRDFYIWCLVTENNKCD